MDLREWAEAKIDAAALVPGGVARLYTDAVFYDESPGWDARESLRCEWLTYLIGQRYFPGGSDRGEPDERYEGGR